MQGQPQLESHIPPVAFFSMRFERVSPADFDATFTAFLEVVHLKACNCFVWHFFLVQENGEAKEKAGFSAVGWCFFSVEPFCVVGPAGHFGSHLTHRGASKEVCCLTSTFENKRMESNMDGVQQTYS